MNDEHHDDLQARPPDIYGKIDALLGRRVGFAPSREGLDLDDFPLLTEVVTRDDGIAGEAPPADGAARFEQGHAGSAEAGAAEFPLPEPVANLPDLGIIPPAYDLDLLEPLPLDPLEERLGELVARQQAQLEAMIRRVVREELERFRRGQ